MAVPDVTIEKNPRAAAHWMAFQVRGLEDRLKAAEAKVASLQTLLIQHHDAAMASETRLKDEHARKLEEMEAKHEEDRRLDTRRLEDAEARHAEQQRLQRREVDALRACLASHCVQLRTHVGDRHGLCTKEQAVKDYEATLSRLPKLNGAPVQQPAVAGPSGSRRRSPEPLKRPSSQDSRGVEQQKRQCGRSQPWSSEDTGSFESAHLRGVLR